MLDGEIVIAKNGGLDFEALQLRLHPAASRVKLLSEADPGVDRVLRSALRGRPRSARRSLSERGAVSSSRCSRPRPPPLHLTPATRDSSVAADWFRRFEGAGLDGVMAKPVAGTYEPNKRVMLKVKHERDCDCVVAGFRWHKNGEGTRVGSLLLGLYDDAGRAPARRRVRELHRCESGASWSSFSRRIARTRSRIIRGKIGPSRTRRRAAGQRMPGGQSRWSQGKDLSWEPLRPELVVEVAYDHMQGDRFRHTAQFRRWRTDKRPSDCTFEQLEVVAAAGARGDLRDRRCADDSSRRSCACVARALAPLARRIVVGVGRLLRRPDRLGDVAQIHADARPRRRTAAHRIDQHVVDRQDALPPRDICSSIARGRRAPPPCRASSRRRSAAFVRAFAARLRGFFARTCARDGATRGASPSILRKCGGHGASPRPAASSRPQARAASPASPARRPCPRADRRSLRTAFGTVSTVKSAGSQSGTSSQSSGVDTRASGSGRTEYAEQVVRSFAFWL